MYCVFRHYYNTVVLFIIVTWMDFRSPFRSNSCRKPCINTTKIQINVLNKKTNKQTKKTQIIQLHKLVANKGRCRKP